ncbi:hypothetical protein BCR44DRAFT_1437336 [Catenaria anguillulae PL171]|uniref:Uncharacterized protein n=1 Tax=Catenaria anguillulae PL171 TaxID=765915 RepID=A0A1Y2HIW7_9FUNG|nr:hypothetical protein BCR44DRAFT_1437336 [Catenaria anguillulae PL171]
MTRPHINSSRWSLISAKPSLSLPISSILLSTAPRHLCRPMIPKAKDDVEDVSFNYSQVNLAPTPVSLLLARADRL